MKYWRGICLLLGILWLCGCRNVPDQRNQLMVNARQAMKDGQYLQAVEYYNRLEALDGDNAEVYNGRGVALLEQREYEKALGDLERAAALNDTNADYWYNIGLCRCCMEQYEEGIQDFTRALELNPEHAQSMCQRGAAYAHLGQYEQAEADVRRAGEIAPRTNADFWAALGSAYVSDQDLERSEAAYDQAILIDSEDAQLYLQRADVCILAGKYDKAHQDLVQAISMKESFLAGYELLGDLYYAQGQYDQAIANYSVALLEQRDYMGYVNRGSCYQELMKYEEAEADYTAAIMLSPQEADAYVKRAEVRELLKDTEGAKKDYKAAKEILEKGARSDGE